MNVATPDVLNITELLNRVDNDHELVSELFFIFKSVFPSHLQRLRDAVAKDTSVGPLLVTMSMGVHQTQNWGVRTVEELLHEVDSAMYAAKAAGRNRISFTKVDISSDADHLASTKAEQSLR